MARSGRSWVVAAVVVGGALAACGGQGSDPTVLLPVVSTTRPSGFGGTLPVETNSTVVPTTGPAVSVATTSGAVSTTDEAALRARVLEYDRAFREELLHEPNPNYQRLLDFLPSGTTADAAFPQLFKDLREQRAYRLNEPNVYRVLIQKISMNGPASAIAKVCVEDNIVALGPGLDGRAQTVDDVIVDSSLGSTLYETEWSLTNNHWVISGGRSERSLGSGAICNSVR